MKKYSIAIDTHVHTNVSGHVWSTLKEDIDQAKLVGLSGMGITDHSSAVPGAAPEWIPASMSMLPHEENGLKLYHGLEADLLDSSGTICPSEMFLARLQYVMVSIHSVCFREERNIANCTAAYLKAIENPYVTILAHMDRISAPCDLELVLTKASENGKVIELNNASLIPARYEGHDNVKKIITICKQKSIPVCVSSDAHYYRMVGDFSLMEQMLSEYDFPEELIVNRSIDAFESMLSDHKEQVEKYQRRNQSAKINGEFVY